MIDNLLDIEVAYKLLQGEKEDDVKQEAKDMDPIDVQYQKLQCKIKVLVQGLIEIFFFSTILILNCWNFGYYIKASMHHSGVSF